MALIKPQNNWTAMPNTWLTDKRLSLKTLGLLVKLNSLPNGWEFSIGGLAAIMQDGKDSVRTAVREAEELGYLTRQGQIKDEEGKFQGGDWVLHENPMWENTLSDSPTQYKNEQIEELTNTLSEADKADSGEVEIVKVERWGFDSKKNWKRIRTVYTTSEEAENIESASESDYPDFSYWPSPALVGKDGKAKVMRGFKKTCFKLYYPEHEEKDKKVHYSSEECY